MKRYIIIGFSACVLLSGYLFFHTGQLKEELTAARTDVKQLQEENKSIAQTPEDQQEAKAHLVAEEFINKYYVFENEPDKKKVEALLTEKAKEVVSFEGDSEVNFEGSHVTSNVENLKLYRGDYTDNRMQILASFNNIITANEISSKSISYATLDLIKDGDTWKIDDLNIAQY
ncbi:hypothetical protein [Rossellomorea yichunensis]|uniref:hypothetical protein n=1 Tax=Rossellomorea yichunensis TaxID=3077331 RepID=UPI0028E034C5|nr:hypothetical protein [Rossellomorea sp. YC4-1]MDT9027504.1 hypothetical protein [Rossellomorea sp. YC4-1]